MAVNDLEVFLRERAVAYDPNVDVAPGSSFDQQVIQPLVRRLGTDPFTVDIATFLHERLTQAFPALATSEGDALNDLLIKPVTLLWDSIVREIQRVRLNMSYASPASMTTDEGDALGANTFSIRRRGDYARIPVRIYFTTPQSISATPSNFCTSKGGLRFYPQNIQTIKATEMLLNQGSDGLYYMDIDVVAENAGTAYNVGKDEIISIANIASAVKVTNLRGATTGIDEETTEQFISRDQQEIGERSLSTLRGIAAKLTTTFPQIDRLNVVGFGDAEMQRDVVTGGGLGPIVAAGSGGLCLPDADNRAYTRRFAVTDDVDFVAITGFTGNTDSGWVLTLIGVDQAGVYAGIAVDHEVIRVIDPQTLEVAEQTLNMQATINTTGVTWLLRQRTLTLSNIPGGILRSNTTDGTLTVRSGQVHIGGMDDIHVRGGTPTDTTMTLTNVVDDIPAASGRHLLAEALGKVTLLDLVLGTDYTVSDQLHADLTEAGRNGWTFQISDGVNAGNYRILRAVQVIGSSPYLVVTPDIQSPSTFTAVWRVFNTINVDLSNPRETRLQGSDLSTVQGSDYVHFASGYNFLEFGVQDGDVLEILSGPDAGNYSVSKALVTPSYDSIQISKQMTQSTSLQNFRIYRSMGGVMQLPLQRVTGVEILDSGNQPTGTFIPYAKPVDVQSRSFQNPSRGVQHELDDVTLGIVTVRANSSGYFPGVTANDTLRVAYAHVDGTFPSVTIILGVTNPTIAQLLADLNAKLSAAFGLTYPMAVLVGADRIGLRPLPNGIYTYITSATNAGTSAAALFGVNAGIITSCDIRSELVVAQGGWSRLNPPFDVLNALSAIHIADGLYVGDYGVPITTGYLPTGSSLLPSPALIIGQLPLSIDSAPVVSFAPDADRRVQLGLRSIGSARCYFMDPTTFEVDEHSRFSTQLDSRTLEYLPDPSMEHPVIPPYGTDTPTDGASTSGQRVFTSVSQDFILAGIRYGDLLSVEYIDLTGTVAIPDSVEAVYKTLVISVDGGVDRTVTFIRDDVSLDPGFLSRAAVAKQINAALGVNIARIASGDVLQFHSTLSVVVRRTGTANALLLGDVAGTSPVLSFVTSDQDNMSPQYGTYTVNTVDSSTQLTVTSNFVSRASFANYRAGQTFRVLRTGVQRCTTTQMTENTAEAGLYYADVELISAGIGDTYNISADRQMVPSNYRSDGYYLTTQDSNLSFSVDEVLGLVVSSTILPAGVDDLPANRTQITGKSLQLNYSVNDIVASVQSYVSSDFERVVNCNPLARSLQNNYVRLDIQYKGGAREDVVLQDLQAYITSLYPVDAIQASHIQKIITDRGATYIKNPLVLLALVHYFDRSIWAMRSEDSITSGRLSSFIPDVMTIKKLTS
jgi:hypothetical protein